MPRPPRDRPLISANFAVTWDGRISTRRHTPSDFSSREDKQRFLAIRALADAVIVTARTAAADGMAMGLPSLRLRAERKARGQAPYPLRVLVSNRGRFPADLPLFAKGTAPVVIFSTTRMPRALQAGLKQKAELVLHPETVDLEAALRHLRQQHGVKRLHCEGGGELFRSLTAAGLVDELYLTLCPRIFGGRDAPTLTGAAGPALLHSMNWTTVKREVVGTECFLHLRAITVRRSIR